MWNAVGFPWWYPDVPTVDPYGSLRLVFLGLISLLSWQLSSSNFSAAAKQSLGHWHFFMTETEQKLFYSDICCAFYRSIDAFSLLLQFPLIIPISYCTLVLSLVAVPLVTKPLQSASGMALMLGTGLPYYIVAVVWKKKPTAWTRTTGEIIHCKTN